MCLLVSARIAALADVQFAGGNGSESSPFRIATPEQLALVRSYAAGYHSFILINNIDLRRFDAGDGNGWLPIGEENPQRCFNGKFDGNGKIISNMVISRPEAPRVGLFGCVSNGAVIANLTLANAAVKGKEDVGALVGLLSQNSTVESCRVTSGVVEGKVSVGGLAGFMHAGALVKNSSANVQVRGRADYTGGFVGEMCASHVENSTSKGAVYSATCGAGGLAGFMHQASSVRNSYSTSSVTDIPDTIEFYDNHYTGGLVGQAFMRSKVENCYASGVVVGTESVGGLIGWGSKNVQSQSSVALNPSVIGERDVNAAYGRMEESQPQGTYTRSDMVVKEQGSVVPYTPLDGSSIDLLQLQKMSFYQSIGWKFGVADSSPWIFNEAANLPVLWFEETPVTSVSLNINMVTLPLGGVYELSATIRPSNARWKEVQWESYDTLVAAVSAAGVVSAKSLGTTFVLARTVDGGHEAICRVNVVPPAALSAEKTAVNVSVYPNPAREELNIEASEEIESVTVYSAAGALLLERRAVGAAAASIDVSQLPKGINVLVVRSRSGVRSLKFVVF